MDQLAAYSSDLDDDNNDANDKVKETSISSTRWHQKCFNDESTDTSRTGTERTGQVESAGINFFGISGSDTQAPSDETELSDGEEPLRHVHVHGSSVELPEGDFWRDFSDAEIPAEKNGLKSDATDSAKPRKRKFETPTRRPNQFVQLQASDTTVAERPKQPSVNSWTNHDCPSSSGNYARCSHSHGDHDHTRTKSAKADPLRTDPTVKVYTVHPKISPHLNRHQGNRCACKESRRWAAHSGVINRVAWCSNPSFSHLIVSASMDSTVRVWNAWGQQQACLRTLTTHSKAVRDAQWSGDGRRILSCSYDRSAAITDVHTGWWNQTRVGNW